jgi:hypothetical protein
MDAVDAVGLESHRIGPCESIYYLRDYLGADAQERLTTKLYGRAQWKELSAGNGNAIPRPRAPWVRGGLSHALTRSSYLSIISHSARGCRLNCHWFSCIVHVPMPMLSHSLQHVHTLASAKMRGHSASTHAPRAGTPTVGTRAVRECSVRSTAVDVTEARLLCCCRRQSSLSVS